MDVRKRRARRPCRLVSLYVYEKITSLEAGSWVSTAACAEGGAICWSSGFKHIFEIFCLPAAEIRMVRKWRSAPPYRTHFSESWTGRPVGLEVL